MKGKKTGGRTVDTPNKATSSLHQLVEEEAGAPLPLLLTRIGVKAMTAGDYPLAVNALSKAAAYVYPRIATADPPAAPLPPITISFQDPLPCSSCGHDPAKDPHVHITREVINGPARP